MINPFLKIQIEFLRTNQVNNPARTIKTISPQASGVMINPFLKYKLIANKLNLLELIKHLHL